MSPGAASNVLFLVPPSRMSSVWRHYNTFAGKSCDTLATVGRKSIGPSIRLMATHQRGRDPSNVRRRIGDNSTMGTTLTSILEQARPETGPPLRFDRNGSVRAFAPRLARTELMSPHEL